jgi:hypothetical protein
MQSKALFFQPMAHRNDLRPPRMPWSFIRMDVARKNERHIVTPLSHTLADQLCHGLVAFIDLGIKKEERYFLRLRELERIANQIQHGLAAPPIVNLLPDRIGEQLLAKGIDLGVVFNRFINQPLQYDWKFQPNADPLVLSPGRHDHKIAEQTGRFLRSMNFTYEDDLLGGLIRPWGGPLGIRLARLGLRKSCAREPQHQNIQRESKEFHFGSP